MKRALILTLLACASLQAAVKISISTDRPQAVYVVGQTATFTVAVTDDNQPISPASLTGEFSSDGFRHQRKTTLSVVHNRAQVQGSLKKPGLLWLRVTCPQTQGKDVQQVMGAAFSPERIKPSLPKPKDFDAFWQRQKERLKAIPIGTTLVRIKSPDPAVQLYRITMNNINDTKIYGYLAKRPGDGPFPAFLQVQWAGVYSVDPNWIMWPAKLGYIALDINAHAIENGKPQSYYDALTQGALKDYYYQGRSSRDTSYFLRMFLSCYRASEYLAARPEWDHQHFLVSGVSQGGGQALVTAGLSPHVTALAAEVPALCDLTANVVGRYGGWPRMVELDNHGKADPAEQQTARYFDAVNFARGIKVPALVGTGFEDLVCPSTSVYAAFNVLQGPKTMVLDPRTGHNGGQVNWHRAYDIFLRQQGGFK